MAIEFDCSFCGHHYKLKDELAGKSATCKQCRNKIAIPTSSQTAADAPKIDAAAAEAAALAALADEPVAEKPKNTVIDVECNFCNHKWTEPITRAGKNALCPNPECRQRVKIPEPKDEGQYDWRQNRSKGPSLAKQNNEKLEGVQDAGEAKVVSGTALKEAGADGIEYEPTPLKRKLAFATVALLLVGGAVFGAVYLTKSRTAGKEDKLMTEALAELTANPDAVPKDEQPHASAVLHLAAAEYALRQNEPAQFKEAQKHHAEAASALLAIQPASATAPLPPARNAALAEVALALVAFGGTEREGSDMVRLRWTPELARKTRINERVYTVFSDLQKLLGRIQSTADFEFRIYLARRLARELAKREQAGLAAELIPLALFAQAEQPEAKALVALEVYRVDKASGVPSAIANELKGEVTKPASAQTLFALLKMDGAVRKPQPGVTPSEAARLAYTGFAALEGSADAVEVAKLPGRAEDQLKALALAADWSSDPGPALESALAVISAAKVRKDFAVPPFAGLKLVQVAAAAGKPDLAKQLADALADEGLKAWAKGDAVRARAEAAPKDKADESFAEVPDDTKRVKAGHLWGRLWVARQNTRANADRAAQAKAVAAWPTPAVPFGKAGVALGLQDK